MASLINKDRREHFETLQVQKRRADKINQICFLFSCAMALEAVISLFVGIGNIEVLPYALFLTVSVICAIIGCIKRNLILSIAAVVMYLAGFIITKQYAEAFVLMGLCLHLIPYCGAVYANYTEHQLRQEEGYPQFDFSLEEKALRDDMEQQTQEAVLAEKRSQSTEMDTI